MEVYAGIPFHTDNDDDPATYFAAAASNYASLQQFDLDLQQQAQATLPQSTWQDFDMFLPQLVFYDNNPVTRLSYSTDSSPLQQPQLMAVGSTAYDNSNDEFVDNAIFNQSLLLSNTDDSSKLVSMPITPPLASFDTPIVLSQQQQGWSDRPQPERPGTTAAAAAAAVAVKTEYPSPEQAPLNSIAKEAKAALIDPLGSPADQMKHFHPTDISALSQWNKPEGKVPIQRLKPPMVPATATAVAPSFSDPASTATTKGPTNTGRQQKKTAHNAIERRYRNNINDRITELKNAVPALLHAKVKDSRTGKRRSVAAEDDDEEAEDGEEYLDGVAVATKLNKATILRKATEYITHLKRTGDDMEHENRLLQHLLSQLPGGDEVLGRYRIQKVQREQEMQQLRLQERQEQQARQQQQRRNRKRTRTQEDYDSSSASDPATPPSSMGNRVFMAVFACLTFFSSSPLGSGTDLQQQQQHPSPHPGLARAIHEHSSGPTESRMGWEALRTVIFVLFLGQLLLPYMRSWLSFNVRRVSRTKAFATQRRSTGQRATAQVMLGDEKVQRIYEILVKAVESEGDLLPRSRVEHGAQIAKEAICLLSRHVFGYEIVYGQTEEDGWDQACRWVKLNEIECLGGNPDVSRWSMLQSCLRSLNRVERLEEDSDQEGLSGMRARVYATAAMQFEVLLPFSGRLSQYFLELGIYEASMASTQEPYLTGLVDSDGAGRPVDTILASQAWREVTDVIRDQTGLAKGKKANVGGLSLSPTAPVVVPVALLSTLDIVDRLRQQFVRLIDGFSQEQTQAETANTLLLSMSAALAEDDQQLRLGSWLAAVALAAEALWKGDVKAAEERLEMVIRRVPRTMTSVLGAQDRTSTKARLCKIDEHTKSSMVQTVMGATLIKRGRTDEGVDQLEQAEALRAMVKKLRTKKDTGPARNLESSVMALAEFAVAVVGLEAWIGAWKTRPELTDKVRLSALDVRRMDGLKHHLGSSSLIDRLSSLGRCISGEVDDDDSISDLDDDHPTSSGLPEESTSPLPGPDERRADRAMDILHGVL